MDHRDDRQAVTVAPVPRREEETAGLFDDWDDDDDARIAEDEWGDDKEFAEWDEDGSGALDEDEGWF